MSEVLEKFVERSIVATWCGPQFGYHFLWRLILKLWFATVFYSIFLIALRITNWRILHIVRWEQSWNAFHYKWRGPGTMCEQYSIQKWSSPRSCWCIWHDETGENYPTIRKWVHLFVHFCYFHRSPGSFVSVSTLQSACRDVILTRIANAKSDVAMLPLPPTLKEYLLNFY